MEHQFVNLESSQKRVKYLSCLSYVNWLLDNHVVDDGKNLLKFFHSTNENEMRELKYYHFFNLCLFNGSKRWVTMTANIRNRWKPDIMCFLMKEHPTKWIESQFFLNFFKPLNPAANLQEIQRTVQRVHLYCEYAVSRIHTVETP